MPRPLIVDLDGVLRLWDPEVMADAERQAGLPRGSMSQGVLGDQVLLHRAVTGLISDDEWREQIVHQLAASSGESAATHAVDQWSKARGSVNTEVLQLIRAERPVRPVAILTNATSRLDEDLAALGLDREVDYVINSSLLGVAKPDPEIFRVASQRLGTTLSDCVFVDDASAHVETAAQLGMTAHLYVDASALRDFLVDEGAV